MEKVKQILEKLCDMTTMSHKLVTIDYKQMTILFDIDKVRNGWSEGDWVEAKYIGGNNHDLRQTETYFSQIVVNKNTIDIQIYIDQELNQFLGIEYKLENLVIALWNHLPMTHPHHLYKIQPIIKL